MEKRNLKRIIHDLENLLTELKSEVYSDPESYKYENYEQSISKSNDYDEVFDETTN